MKTKALPFFICITLVLIIFSCSIKKRIYLPGYHVEWFSKNKTKPLPHGKDFSGFSINSYDALSVKPSCENIIESNAPSTIYCTEGTVLEIPENAFMYEKGGDIKCTKVNVVVNEFYQMADIIEAGLTTTCNDKILASGGMVYIAATCMGEKLKLKPHKKIIIKMPTNDYQKGMRIFLGNQEKEIVDWEVGSQTKKEQASAAPILEGIGDGMLYDSVEGYESETDFQNTYVMEATKLGWINCDRFYDVKEPVNIFVSADTSKNNSVAVIFRNMKSVLPGYAYTNCFTEFHRLPKGEPVTVLAYRINKKTKQTFVGREDVTLGEMDSVKLKMEEVDLAQFKSILKEFN